MEEARALRDKLLLGAQIRTSVDDPIREALLVRQGRVFAVGAAADLRALAGAGAEIVELDGGWITPGLTDAHIHPTAWALARRRIALHDAGSPHEVAERVRAAAHRQTGDGWLRGQGWYANAWAEAPRAEILDAAVADRPVALESHDLHSLWLNSEALRRAGITRDTPDPDGGRIERDPATGEPTGVLLETACAAAFAAMPEPGSAEVQDALEDAQRELHGWGVTGIHSVEPTGISELETLRQRGRLRLRVLQTIPFERVDEALRLGLRSGFGGEWLRIGGVKMFLDGALGSRTAWLRDPYEGEAEYRGISTLPPAEFRETVRRIARAGITATVHAIGDAAVELAIDVLGEARGEALAMPHRIEHVQLCPPELWERAGRSGAVGSMQPIHLMTDIAAAERHWGHERSRGAYAFAALARSGMPLAFGSDAPVESPDPRLGLFAAVRRVGWDGEPRGEWFPEHRMTMAAALHAYSAGPAHAAGAADSQGRLRPGYHADLACWDRDPLGSAPEQVREMRCRMTMVGGEIVSGGNHA
jgi:predicted amidohydrolase YtcJ